MYTAKQPLLRRYGDLIVHWQIEAALLEEARRGTSSWEILRMVSCPSRALSLTGARPAQLRVRERHARLLDNLDGTAEWMPAGARSGVALRRECRVFAPDFSASYLLAMWLPVGPSSAASTGSTVRPSSKLVGFNGVA